MLLDIFMNPMRSSGLQDGMGSAWRPDVIAAALQTYIDSNGIPDLVSTAIAQCMLGSFRPLPFEIITFDSDGITHHPNHTPLSAGVKRVFDSLDQDLPSSRRPRLLTLETVPKYIKFTSLLYPTYESIAFHLGWSSFSGAATSPARKLTWNVTSSATGYWQALRAMLQHRSQLVWFRWLYVAFSKYMWSNRLLEVDLLE